MKPKKKKPKTKQIQNPEVSKLDYSLLSSVNTVFIVNIFKNPIVHL